MIIYARIGRTFRETYEGSDFWERWQFITLLRDLASRYDIRSWRSTCVALLSRIADNI